MRTRFVGHACLEIEVAGITLVSDPWWAGPAYTGQWYPWPTPELDGLEERPIDVLYLSHGHEDHLHPATLARLRRGATVLVPALVAGRMEDHVRSLGFPDVVPMRHGESYGLGRGGRATCYVNATDSLLVVEDRGEVVVDANDALHASPPAIADHLCRLVAARHPRIDVLFMGYGGASWFPNCIRFPGKDDRAAARGREELLSENFARVVERLRPRLACGFAASFVLLEPHLRWVNEVKLEVAGPAAAVARRPATARRSACRVLSPGDVVMGTEVLDGPRGRPHRADLERAYRDELAAGCARSEVRSLLPAPALEALAAAILARAREGGRALPAGAAGLELWIREAPDAAIRLSLAGGAPDVRLAERRGDVPALELRAEVLRALLEEPYGSESITIGCGAVAHLGRREDLGFVLGALRLLSPRRGSWRSVAAELRRSPLRVARDVVAQRWPLALHAATRAGLLETLQDAG